MNTDLQALQTAVEHGKTAWLLNRQTGEVARLRAVSDGYELVQHAGTPMRMAHGAADHTPVEAHSYPDPSSHLEKELHTLMQRVANEYQEWTEDRAELDDGQVAWGIDMPG